MKDKIHVDINTQERIVLWNDQAVFVDCDDTMILWSYPEGIDTRHLTHAKDVHGNDTLVFLNHQRHIDFVKRLYRQGVMVIVWSAAGTRWADHTADILGLDGFVTVTMCKPKFMLDDLSADKFMPKNTFLDPFNPMKDKDEDNRFHTDGKDEP